MIGWSRCLRAFLGTLGICAALLFAFLLSVDPYDSGRFGVFGIDGMADRNSTTANASRARDPNFDSAIIGNSTALLLNPDPLSRATGLGFVQLSVVGGSPREEMAVLDFFLRHHPRVGALVFVTDPGWCEHTQREKPRPFPYWLYGDSSVVYAGYLFSGAAIEHAVQRVSIGLGTRRRNDPSGTFNSEDVWPAGQFFAKNSPADPPPAMDAASRDVFPEVTKLDDVVRKLPPDVPVVILVPPTFATTVPQPGSAVAVERQACNAALSKIIAGRPHSNFIDYRVDNALTRDRANFVDYIHYRPLIAAKISEGIAASIHLGEAAKIDF
ncbi:MAG TPA: hypothetical protein VID30_11730 [Bradyrhizobium sp.]|jgi:hypothetical protein